MNHSIGPFLTADCADVRGSAFARGYGGTSALSMNTQQRPARAGMREVKPKGACKPIRLETAQWKACIAFALPPRVADVHVRTRCCSTGVSLLAQFMCHFETSNFTNTRQVPPCPAQPDAATTVCAVRELVLGVRTLSSRRCRSHRRHLLQDTCHAVAWGYRGEGGSAGIRGIRGQKAEAIIRR